MTDFLLELRSEEIPARMQAGARADLEKLFRKEMQAAGVAVGAVTVWSTPRRLALIARDLPLATEAVREETKGPAATAPEQALEGFLRKTGLTRDQLEVRDVKGKDTYFAVVEKPGRAVSVVLAEAIPAIVRAFPWPKSQRWGAASISTESLRWVRPLSGIVAILGEDLVECEVGGIRSAYTTKGHRFHHPDEITIGGANDYADKLRACHVIVDHEERQDLVRTKAREAAEVAGLTLVEDEGLVIENAGLTEWPVPLLGRFDEDFLEVPPETIQLTARVNQKYFVCEKDGQLADAFVCTANIVASDGGEGIVAGNRKVLAARLSDARFFWEQDRKTPLSQHAKKLERITFHEKLGTVADKVERVAKLAQWLASEGIVPGCDPAQARQAAELCKADLVTEMVGEFPELQGLMGGYYARAEGLPDAVADAIRDHYKPVGAGDDVPTAPVTVALALADKLDTISGFFFEGMPPTGSRDPFALRRAALGVIALLQVNGVRVPLKLASTVSIAHLGKLLGRHSAKSIVEYIDAMDAVGLPVSEQAIEDAKNAALNKVLSNEAKEKLIIGRIRPTVAEILDFFADRLKVQQKEAGVRHDLIDAVFALGGEDDLVRLLARVHALQAFVETEDGTNLLAGYKRAANILKKEDWSGQDDGIEHTGDEDPLENVDDPDMQAVYAAELAEQAAHKGLSYTPEKAEKALIDALDNAEPKAAAAVAAEDFASAMAALASLRQPIDAFFDEVTVNDPEPSKRTARLALLDRFRAAVHNVADFSKVEG
ncbi:glycine--tRNA ligase subunit beta [Novosphingobium pentaromativorans]|uniref:Glycine--tRNA ligase beta subunit n=1 Tax=Novosphingobium pentaromativorans US6-1 TaxID=1088721 RepID=G6EJ68_9SPHN|nr:glycine--tRNA ligase subunit beta [Novosphingobium pentaromativorans]AIT79026.1 glycyl-tRNA synthetase subunit beta [Novosphingobium pentaromativorans US6-1]EHJ58654.1 glycyl-tRNA synthetase beta chain [Novosphingobium pentaromativorans US6-1]